MSQANPKNLPASVRARLQNISQQRDIPFDLILARFAVERLLYRLSRSKHANQFLLKGAMLFAIWTPEAHRPTRDVDLLGFGSTDLEEVKAVFVEICGASVLDDGLKFQAETLDVSYIREEAHYGGVRVGLGALLGNVRIPVQIDIGFGDVITPGPEMVTFPRWNLPKWSREFVCSSVHCCLMPILNSLGAGEQTNNGGGSRHPS